MTREEAMSMALDKAMAEIDRNLWNAALLLKRHGATSAEMLETIDWLRTEMENDVITGLACLEKTLLADELVAR